MNETIRYKLEEAAEKLNAVSDALSGVVAQIDLELRKLNLGLEVWHSAGNEELDIGYARVNGHWGIAIRKDKEKWLFRNAPRKYRIETIDHLPEVLVALTKEAERM